MLFVNTLEVFILSYVLLELAKTILVVITSNKIIKHNLFSKDNFKAALNRFKNFKNLKLKFAY